MSSSSVSSSAKHIFAKFFPKAPPKRVRRGIPREKTPPDTRPKGNKDKSDIGVIMQIAETRRLAKQRALGTELEQLTRNYETRLAVSSPSLSAASPSREEPDPNAPDVLPTMDYFNAQILRLEPQRTLENAKEKLSQPITELLLRALSIFRAAWDAGVTGYSNVRMNTVVRVRLREILDFAEEDPSATGVVSEMEVTLPITSPFPDTIEYFNKLEFKQGPDSPIKARLRAYFAKTYGVRDDAKKLYTFIPALSVLEMTIEDIVAEAVRTFCENPRINRRTKRSLKGRFQDYLSNLQKAELLTGNTLKMRCMRRVEGVRNDEEVAEEGKGLEDDYGGKVPPAVDISCLRQRPVMMQEEDAWLLLSVIGLDQNGVIKEEELVPTSVRSVSRGVTHETAVRGAKAKKKRRTKRKKAIKTESRKYPPQKWSKRKKMRKLRELLDQKDAKERAQREAEYHALHANTEGEEYKKRAYRPSKAAIMLNERNFYDDARLHTRRPGSRASVFEPALENTSFGRAHGLDVERDPNRAANYTFRRPKGILKALAQYDYKHVKRTPSRASHTSSRRQTPPPAKASLQRSIISGKGSPQNVSGKTASSPQRAASKKAEPPQNATSTKFPSPKKASPGKNTSSKKTSPYKLQERTSSPPPHSTTRPTASSPRRASALLPPTTPTHGPLRNKAKDLIDDKHERSARFGSLRNLGRAIEHSRRMRVEIAAISTTPDPTEFAPIRRADTDRGRIGSRGSAALSNTGGSEMSVRRRISQQSLGSRSEVEPLDIGQVQGGDLDMPNDVMAADGNELDDQEEEEEEEEDECGLDDEDGYEDYDEDYDDYWDDDYEEYDPQSEDVNKIEAQLRMLQELYAQRVAENGKGMSAKAGACVPGLPRGFINGQIAMTRTAQRKHDVQNKMVQLFLKNVNKHGAKQRKHVYDKVNRAKNRKPRSPFLIEMIVKLFSKKKKTVLTKDQLLAQLKGTHGKIPEDAGKKGDTTKPVRPGDSGVEVLQGEAVGEEKTLGAGVEEGKAEDGKDEKEDKAGGDADGEEAKNGEKGSGPPEEDDDDDDDDEEEEVDPALQQAIDELKAKKDQLDEKARESLRHFQIYLDECKGQYKVICGEEKTHATNFRDVYSEWLVRNRAKRTHFGWDPDPPPPPPRRRERPLNAYALKRIEKERDKSVGIVTIAGQKYSLKELFERKRIARRNARPPSLALRIWRFFI